MSMTTQLPLFALVHKARLFRIELLIVPAPQGPSQVTLQQINAKIFPASYKKKITTNSPQVLKFSERFKLYEHCSLFRKVFFSSSCALQASLQATFLWQECCEITQEAGKASKAQTLQHFFSMCLNFVSYLLVDFLSDLSIGEQFGRSR